MEIRERAFGESLNEWFRVLGRSWKAVLWPSLIAYSLVGVGLLVVLILAGGFETMANLFDPDYMDYLDSLSEEELLDVFIPFLWTLAAMLILQWIATVYVSLSTSRAVFVYANGGKATVGEVHRFAMGRIGRMLTATFLYGLAGLVLMGLASLVVVWLALSDRPSSLLVFLGAVIVLTLIAVGIHFGVGAGFYGPVIAAEDTSAAGALARGYKLVQGRWWMTVGYLLVIGLIVSAASQAVSLILTPLFFAAALAPFVLVPTYLLAMVLQGPFTAAGAAAQAIWYIDLRTRNEALAPDDLL